MGRENSFKVVGGEKVWGWGRKTVLRGWEEKKVFFLHTKNRLQCTYIEPYVRKFIKLKF